MFDVDGLLATIQNIGQIDTKSAGVASATQAQINNDSRDVSKTHAKKIHTALGFMFGLNRAKISREAAWSVLGQMPHDPVALGLIAESKSSSFTGQHETQGKVKTAFVKAVDAGLEREAKSGNALAQWLMGRVNETGSGMAERNYTAAMEWYRMAAEQGLSMGQFRVGWMFHNGFGVSADYAEAMMWDKKAAQQGDAMGQNDIAFFYGNGLGVAQDHATAVLWYKKAVDQNYAISQSNLSRMYEAGLGVKKDVGRALELLKQAAAQGHRCQSRIPVLTQALTNSDPID
eukprot:c1361_g1_i1.p1 GENE.c1361_g1_i1~~c1361_g1_i1.p1  ORF type:complete len:288 (+),score=68.07 c1361_g1_i1:1277-2140(+)